MIRILALEGNRGAGCAVRTNACRQLRRHGRGALIVLHADHVGVSRDVLAVIDDVGAAAVLSLIGLPGGFEGQRVGVLADQIAPNAAREHLPLVADALGVVTRVFHHGDHAAGGVGVDVEGAFVRVKGGAGEHDVWIPLRRLGAGHKDLAGDAVVGHIGPHGLDLVGIFGVGVQILVNVGKGVSAVGVPRSRCHRDKGQLVAARAVGEFIVAIQLEARRHAVVGPGQADLIVGGQVAALGQIRGQGRGGHHITDDVVHHGEAVIVDGALIGAELPVVAVAIGLGFLGHALQHAGEVAARHVDLHLAEAGVGAQHHAHRHASGAAAQLVFNGDVSGEGVAVLMLPAQSLADGGAAGDAAVAHGGPVAVVDRGAGGGDGLIGGRVVGVVGEDDALQGGQLFVVLGDGLVVVQLQHAHRGAVGDGDGHGALVVAPLAVGREHGVPVDLGGDGVEGHRVGTGRGAVFHGLGHGRGLFKVPGAAAGDHRLVFDLGDLDAEHGKLFLDADVSARRDGGARGGAAAAAGGGGVAGARLGVVAGEIVPLQQIAEGGRRGHRCQHLGVAVGQVVLAGVLQIGGVVVAVQEAEGGVGGAGLELCAAKGLVLLCVVGIQDDALEEFVGVLIEAVIGNFRSIRAKAPGVRDRKRDGINGSAGQTALVGDQRAVAVAEQVGAVGPELHIERAGIFLGAALRQDGIYFHVSLDMHLIRVVQGGNQLQPLVGVLEDQAVKVEQRGFVQPPGDGGQIGQRQGCGVEDVPVLAAAHDGVGVIPAAVLFKEVEVLLINIVEAVARFVELIQRHVAGVRVLGGDVAYHLAAQHQRLCAGVGQVAVGEGDPDQVLAVSGRQREVAVRLQHGRAVAVQDGGPGGAVNFVGVEMAVGDGQIVAAVPVKVPGGQADHVGNQIFLGLCIIFLGQRIAPGSFPGGRGFIGSVGHIGGDLQLVHLDAGVIGIGDVNGHLVIAVVVKVPGGNLQIVLILEGEATKIIAM